MLSRNTAATAVLFASLPAYGQTALPAGAGKEATVKICGECHEIETVISARRTRIGWKNITEDMITRGAEGSEEDMAKVIEYLTANFGKVNVNSASAAELQKALGLTEAEARAIVGYREQNGKIKDFDELSKIAGANAEKLRQKRALVAFSQ